MGNDKVRFDFQLCRPTEYAYSAFDNVNDARMWKTFKTVFVLNSTAQTDKNKIVADNGLKDVSQPASTSFAPSHRPSSTVCSISTQAICLMQKSQHGRIKDIY